MVISPPSPILIGEESVNSNASSDSSHNKKLPAVSPKNLTSCPVPSTPVVIVAMQVNAEPVKVKFASPSNSVVVLPIVVNLLALQQQN